MSTGWIVPDGTGTRIQIHVVPRASKSAVCGMQGEALKIRLNAPPVDGKANKALCAFVAELLKIPSRQVQLVAGETSRQKMIHVAGLSPEAIQSQLGL